MRHTDAQAVGKDKTEVVALPYSVFIPLEGALARYGLLTFIPINLPYTKPPEEAMGCVKVISPGVMVPYH